MDLIVLRKLMRTCSHAPHREVNSIIVKSIDVLTNHCHHTEHRLQSACSLGNFFLCLPLKFADSQPYRDTKLNTRIQRPKTKIPALKESIDSGGNQCTKFQLEGWKDCQYTTATLRLHSKKENASIHLFTHSFNIIEHLLAYTLVNFLVNKTHSIPALMAMG